MSKVTAIVLAAGESRRMGEGRQKLLMDAGGGVPMIRHVVDAVVKSCVSDVIVVTGGHHEQIAEVLGGVTNVRLARNPYVSRGMLSSVRCGLQAIDSTPQGIAVLLGDQPGIDAGIIDDVVVAWRNSESRIAVPTWQGRRGHPLVFDGGYRDEVLTEFDEVGLRGLLAAHPDDVMEVPLQSREVLEDIDTPEDYDRLARVNE